jgi:hypothetical protein
MWAEHQSTEKAGRTIWSTDWTPASIYPSTNAVYSYIGPNYVGVSWWGENVDHKIVNHAVLL